MSFLEDGEYELDVSILLDNPSTNNNSFNDNIAIRYGFIPDSMDQSKPLKLYQQDQTCILKATLSDSDPTPIFFEGIPQRYQINNTTSSNTNNDAYYLTFNSQNHTTNNNNNNNNKVVELKKLDSTIKFNKSRNVSKLQNQIKTMEKQYQVQQRQQLKLLKNDNNTRTPTPNPNPNPNPNLSSNSSVILPPSKKSTPKTSPLRKPPKPTVTPVRKMASKRPPSATNTPEIKPKESSSEPIISESDFEDLEMDDKLTEEVPIIEFNFDNYDNDEDKKEKVVTKSNNENQNITKGMELKPKPKPKPSEETSKTKVKPQPRKQKKQKKPLSEETVDLTDDLDDDFKDLEDQLEELLEEEEQPKQQQIKETKSNQSIQKKPSPTIEVDPIAFNDSDESDFEDFHFTGIKIDEGNNNNSSSSNNNNKTKNISIDNGNSNEELNFNKTVLGGKPRSLRDLILGGNTPNIDDGSSSEEE